MPVVLRIRGYKFLFYEADLEEPPHIHVRKENKEAKYWLDPIAAARPGRFKKYELNEIEKIIEEYIDDILKAWRKEQQKSDNS